MRKRLKDRDLTALFAEYRGDLLLAGEARWRSEVPDSTERAAERAFSAMDACIAAGLPLAAAGTSAAKGTGAAAIRAAGGLGALKIVAITLAASAVIGAGGYAAVPAVREYVHSLVQASETTGTGRTPQEYDIPSPGEEFWIEQEVSNERLAVRWFRSDTQLYLVEIAYELPEGYELTESPSYVTVGGRPAALYEAEDTALLILREGELSVLVECFHADRQALMDYAEKLINGDTSE